MATSIINDYLKKCAFDNFLKFPFFYCFAAAAVGNFDKELFNWYFSQPFLSLSREILLKGRDQYSGPPC